ncbi:M48 family peptidase [Hymenobacter sediminis]|uniref:M48 family metallopeptidase n=1 Tax=Hymenobacter sediminis TaxID=2218621 RepID=UPI000DA6AD1F|nr:SprT family zinc-dependent metalloprotease [Hymenobacter sediminis]RPD43766.1 M48 family peptidase [Hymenobacter sediminis]
MDTSKKSPAELGQVQFGSATIAYTVERRRRKSLALTVYPNGQLAVVAPLEATAEQVASAVLRRAGWVLRQQEQAQLQQHYAPSPSPRRYLSGESYLFLGRQYRLRIVSATRPAVHLHSNYLQVSTPTPDDATAIKRLVERWYRKQAREQLTKSFEGILRRLPPILFNPADLPRLRILRMPNRWGSCATSTGTVQLNPDLVKTPVPCIEYVIIHELAHLRVRRHSQEFYDLQSRLMPDWQIWEKRLQELEPGMFETKGQY